MSPGMLIDPCTQCGAAREQLSYRKAAGGATVCVPCLTAHPGGEDSPLEPADPLLLLHNEARLAALTEPA